MWFADRFGSPYPRLGYADEADGYHASIVHAVGVRMEDDDGLDIAARFGPQDMFDMVIGRNRAGQCRVPYGQGRACARHLAEVGNAACRRKPHM